jgi:cyclopropane fatty-acyl-phospholipid synthase-like methyltransferase
MMTAFTELNSLILGEDGVYRGAESPPFNYSDGVESEQKLAKILVAASNLSSESAELDAQIVDWPTEYHLSSTRANLLRGLNLDGVTHVLELGCGCGSISRFLGEQAGLKVDSVEGSPSRAALAALRCRDLDNVSISTGNFNQMAFPQNHYDLVLFVGVTEYAGRFSERATDQQALQDLLGLAKSTMSAKGVVFVAIENRTGLKYLMGAGEDHYALPYIGLDDYPESTGIRTYSKSQWEVQIQQAGFVASRFAYPFPDYKVPTLLIADDTEQARAQSNVALAKIRSRDYIAPFDLGDQEARLWQGVLEAGCLAEFANSFLILLGQDSLQLEQMLNFDVIEYKPGPSYLKPSAVEVSELDAPPIGKSAEVKELLSQIDALHQHAASLQSRVDIITQSRSWGLINRLRVLLGKSNFS